MRFKAFFAVITGFFLFIFLWLGSIIVDQVWNSGTIMPGISMQGIDLSGLTIDEAAQKLSTEFAFTATDEISLTYADIVWQASPAQLGLSLDPQGSARQAYDFGRKGSLGSFLAYQLMNRRSKHDLPAIVVFDQQKAYDYLVQVSQAYDLPLREAGLELNGTQVIAIPGQAGRKLDIPASLDRLTEQARRGDFSSFTLALIEQQPDIMDASPFAAAAQEILARPFILQMPQGQPDAGRNFTIEPEDMAPMLIFTRSSRTDRRLWFLNSGQIF